MKLDPLLKIEVKNKINFIEKKCFLLIFKIYLFLLKVSDTNNEPQLFSCQFFKKLINALKSV